MSDTLHMNAEQDAAFADINAKWAIGTYRVLTDLTVVFRCEDGDTGVIDVDGTWDWVQYEDIESVISMPDQFVPMFDRLLVKEQKLEEETLKSGVVLPATREEARSLPNTGFVIAVGPGLDWWKQYDIVMPVKKGDKVLFPPHAGTYIKVEEEDLLVLRVGELLGVMEHVSLADALRDQIL